MTKGRRKAAERRVLRKGLNRHDCGRRGKMVGRLCRYGWGSGVVEGARERD